MMCYVFIAMLTTRYKRSSWHAFLKL